jgi:molybdopterin-guanine dinucleotide biosynthesis protein MobB
VQGLPKIVAVVGGKHSGKTTVIEHLVAELKSRKFHVATIKEMVRVPTLDTPATETDRYSRAGAEVVVAVPREETVIFIKKRLNITEILPHLAGVDYVVLEGFEHERNLPKIIAAKTADEAEEYLGSCAIAISGLVMESEAEKMKAKVFQLPMLKSLTQAKELADLVEQKAKALADLD